MIITEGHLPSGVALTNIPVLTPGHERRSAKLQAGKPEPNGTGTPAGGPSGPPCRPHGDGAVPPGGRARACRCHGDGHGGGSLALGGHHRR